MNISFKVLFFSINTQEFYVCQAHVVFLLWRKKSIHHRPRFCWCRTGSRYLLSPGVCVWHSADYTFCLLFTSAGAAFFSFTVRLVINAKCLRGVFCLSFLGDLSSKCSREGNDVKGEVSTVTDSRPSDFVLMPQVATEKQKKKKAQTKSLIKTLWPCHQQFEDTTIFS